MCIRDRVEAGVLHGTGKELVYSLFGQSCDGKITLFRPFELHRIAAGKILLFQKLTQVVQHFMAAFLCVVPGSNTDHGKGIVGRCSEVLCFPLLQRPLIATAYYYKVSQMLAKFARLQGLEDEAKEFEKDAAKLKTASMPVSLQLRRELLRYKCPMFFIPTAYSMVTIQ